MEEIDIKNEKEHLEDVLDEIDSQIEHTNNQIEELEEELDELKSHFSDQYYFLDDEETVTGGDEMDDSERVVNETKAHYYRLKKQRLSPYFGKITFYDEEIKQTNDYYIGTFNLTNGQELPLVCDWRAPVSTMYYDYEIGKAKYDAPCGEIKGEIKAKRQFKIKDSQMQMCFDSNLTIGDDILQQELANNASDKMKNIVATIQSEQNKVIRDESPILFVQGVAGSGKTSIALHRVAYLLYKYREKYKSNDILILSPNDIFSEYISTVLPSLGEENILNTSFYRLAQGELMALVYPLQTREDGLNKLAENAEKLNEVAYKNSFEFADSLKLYLKTYVNLYFEAHDLKFGDVVIKKQEIEDLYNKKYENQTPAIRVSWIADYVIDKLDITQNVEDVAQRIKKVIYSMFIKNNLEDIYADFLDRIGLKFEYDDNKIRYEDIAPILYIKNYMLGLKKQNVKFLVIDEMQDYSPIHFELFNEIYECPKTVLGDINQCIEKIIEETELDKYAGILNAKEIIELKKTYRSTYEIVEFADKIKGISSNKVERHGEVPKVEICQNIQEEAEKITEIVKNNANFDSIAIICKTQKQAQEYYAMLGEIEELKLIDENCPMSKVMVMPASLSKGLEFDMVIIPNATEENYKNFLDKNLLYVSCTRALHKLFVTTSKSITKFLK